MTELEKFEQLVKDNGIVQLSGFREDNCDFPRNFVEYIASRADKTVEEVAGHLNEVFGSIIRGNSIEYVDY